MTPLDEVSTAKIIESSITASGKRLDTVQCRLWRPVWGEVLTHRVFSRNASSGRAIPAASILAREETYVPRFRKNKPGMQPGSYLSDEEQKEAEKIWLQMANTCREGVRYLSAKDGLNVHKQWANRAIEWFGWIDVLITSSNWSNFDALRRHDAAQDEVHLLADVIYEARMAAKPKLLVGSGDWHLPFIKPDDKDYVRFLVESNRLPDIGHAVIAGMRDAADLLAVPASMKILLAMSAARACRLSYAKHDGEPSSFEDDMKRYLQLMADVVKHSSPTEHQAREMSFWDQPHLQGNLTGFVQFRKCIPGENL